MRIEVNLHTLRRPLYMGLLLLILKSSISYSAIIPYGDLADNILSVFGLALLTIEILSKRYSSKRLMAYVVIGFLSLISVQKTGYYTLFWTVVICMAICDEDIDKIASFMYKCQITFLILHTIMALIAGIISGYSLFSDIIGVLRWNAGFVHPNTVSIYLFGIIVLWVWLNFERITKKHIGNIMLLSLAAYILTKTRTALLVQLVFLFLLAWYKSKIRSTKFLNWCSALVVPVIGGLLFFFIHSYSAGNSLSAWLDRLLSGRIRLGAYAYERYGLTMFGENLKNMEVVWDEIWRLSGHTFDSVYSFFFSNQGLIWLAVIIIAFACLVKRKCTKINIMLLVWSLYGISETHVLDGTRFFPILLVSLLIGSEESQANSKYKIP